MPPFDQIRAWLDAYFAHRLAKKTARIRAQRNELIAMRRIAKRQHRNVSQIDQQLMKLLHQQLKLENRL
ncbi:hypothetical protein ACN6KF_001503 [Labrys sp. La1]|uniref:hypothetical protein n=1 Tax=Labrys sp. La1 TaxID=3404917 RepID=UPI003EBE3923